MTHASSICRGTIFHARATPARHQLRQAAVSYLLDLDELPRLERELAPLFGASQDRRRPVSIDPAAYLSTEDGATVRARLAALLARTNAGGFPPGRVLLHTNLAVAGYAFNPVSLWFCHDAGGTLQAVVIEVGNTYGERHPYVLRARDMAEHGGRWRATMRKEFHVSPFNDLDMTYEVEVVPPTLADAIDAVGEPVRFSVRARPDAGGPPFIAVQSGVREPLTRASLLHAQARFPLFPQQVIARIHLHALRLWRKRVPFHRKPDWVPRVGSLRPAGDKAGLESTT